ncbi:43650_t:CDS:2 [Gigaspora margarita]|uniref:43650_t:CDS:1 n=1 Tax=Gigaspora margarita TaxID=4874 RepID=A0ABN7UP98_GIGMA|nr:43650_t:CDS:2 [Gigaspora margarita]
MPASRIKLPEQHKFKVSTNDQEYFTILGYNIDNKGNLSKTLWSELESQHYLVQKALKSLYKTVNPQNNSNQDLLKFKWINSKWSLTRKRILSGDLYIDPDGHYNCLARTFHSEIPAE